MRRGRVLMFGDLAPREGARAAALGRALAGVLALQGTSEALAIAVVPLIGVVSLRLLVRLFASYKAYRGQAWVIPGLGWLSGRWVPAG